MSKTKQHHHVHAREKKSIAGKALQVFIFINLNYISLNLVWLFCWSNWMSAIFIGAGLLWEHGVRRSTRIRTRPLEYWKGERLLYGRIHQSKYSLVWIS